MLNNSLPGDTNLNRLAGVNSQQWAVNSKWIEISFALTIDLLRRDTFCRQCFR